jgi:MYXO-CTERM domain-containing protein
MRRATERLCAMDPGDRCVRARQKLADATAHVTSACPSCPEATGRTFPESQKAEEAPAPASNAAVAEETVQKKSGGCTLASAHDGSPGAAWLLGLALLVLRKRRAARARDD